MPEKKEAGMNEENIKAIMRNLMNCSKKLSKEIRNLRTSLEVIEQTQKELQRILGGGKVSTPGLFFPSREPDWKEKFDKGD